MFHGINFRKFPIIFSFAELQVEDNNLFKTSYIFVIKNVKSHKKALHYLLLCNLIINYVNDNFLQETLFHYCKVLTNSIYYQECIIGTMSKYPQEHKMSNFTQLL